MSRSALRYLFGDWDRERVVRFAAYVLFLLGLYDVMGCIARHSPPSGWGWPVAFGVAALLLPLTVESDDEDENDPLYELLSLLGRGLMAVGMVIVCAPMLYVMPAPFGWLGWPLLAAGVLLTIFCELSWEDEDEDEDACAAPENGVSL